MPAGHAVDVPRIGGSLQQFVEAFGLPIMSGHIGRRIFEQYQAREGRSFAVLFEGDRAWAVHCRYGGEPPSWGQMADDAQAFIPRRRRRLPLPPATDFALLPAGDTGWTVVHRDLDMKSIEALSQANRPATIQSVIHPALVVVLEEGRDGWTGHAPLVPGCTAAGVTRRQVERDLETAITARFAALHSEAIRADASPC